MVASVSVFTLHIYKTSPLVLPTFFLIQPSVGTLHVVCGAYQPTVWSQC